MINQIHHSTDGSWGIKVICQCFHHAGFSLSQPEETQILILCLCLKDAFWNQSHPVTSAAFLSSQSSHFTPNLLALLSSYPHTKLLHQNETYFTTWTVENCAVWHTMKAIWSNCGITSPREELPVQVNTAADPSCRPERHGWRQRWFPERCEPPTCCCHCSL